MPDHRPPPRLRWHTEDVTRSPIFVVPGESTGSSSVAPRGKTWGIRERGDTGKLVLHAYRCPVHGVFDLRVPVSDVPNEVACPERGQRLVPATQFLSLAEAELVRDKAGHVCGLTSHWAGSSCSIGVEPGQVTG